MRHFLIPVAMACVVAGCASDHSEEAAAASAAVHQACQSASVGPEAAVIRGQTFVEVVTEISADMLSNPNVPTVEEAAAISSLDARRIQCRNQIIAWSQSWNPAEAPILQDQFFKETVALGDLIQRKTTYGDANRRIYQAYLEAEKSTETQRQDQLAATRAEEERRRALAIAILASRPPVQVRPPPIYAPPASTTTNCTSSVIGNQVYTNCH